MSAATDTKKKQPRRSNLSRGISAREDHMVHWVRYPFVVILYAKEC